MRLKCQTRYPIVLVHGLGFRDRKHLNYWGRIPGRLMKNGATVFYGNQDSNGTIESNAQQLKNRIKAILQETGAEKVNVIAHSKGGLDARYAITALGMSPYVASLTTVATPHHGSYTIDHILALPDILIRMVALFLDFWHRLFGDAAPDSYRLFHQFTTTSMKEFNQSIPDCVGVYYQSYAFAMRHFWSDVFLLVPHMVVQFLEGDNDGLVSVASAQWTNFRGVVESATGRGISHCDEVDMRRCRLSRKTKENCITDINDFYIALVTELKDRGF